MTAEEFYREAYKSDPEKAELMATYCCMSDDDRMRVYETGAFNRITEGYLIYVLAMLGLGEHIPDAIEELKYAHDMIDPRTAYRKWLMGELG